MSRTVLWQYLIWICQVFNLLDLLKTNIPVCLFSPIENLLYHYRHNIDMEDRDYVYIVHP